VLWVRTAGPSTSPLYDGTRVTTEGGFQITAGTVYTQGALFEAIQLGGRSCSIDAFQHKETTKDFSPRRLRTVFFLGHLSILQRCAFVRQPS